MPVEKLGPTRVVNTAGELGIEDREGECAEAAVSAVERREEVDTVLAVERFAELVDDGAGLDTGAVSVVIEVNEKFDAEFGVPILVAAGRDVARAVLVDSVVGSSEDGDFTVVLGVRVEALGENASESSDDGRCARVSLDVREIHG